MKRATRSRDRRESELTRSRSQGLTLKKKKKKSKELYKNIYIIYTRAYTCILHTQLFFVTDPN